jgi:hypothetical protein
MINSKIVNVKKIYICTTLGGDVASDNKMLTFALAGGLFLYSIV